MPRFLLLALLALVPAANLTGELTHVKGAKIPVPLPWTEGKARPVKKGE